MYKYLSGEISEFCSYLFLLAHGSVLQLFPLEYDVCMDVVSHCQALYAQVVIDQRL